MPDARTIWADAANESAASEKFMEKNGFVSHDHRKKPKARDMTEAIRPADNARWEIRCPVEHVFAEQKERMDLFIPTVGIGRARSKIGLANLICSIKRLLFPRRIAAAWRPKRRRQRPQLPRERVASNKTVQET